MKKLKPDLDSSQRITSIIAEQKLLIEQFQEKGDKKVFAKFQELAAEFQQIHESHQFNKSSK